MGDGVALAPKPRQRLFRAVERIGAKRQRFAVQFDIESRKLGNDQRIAQRFEQALIDRRGKEIVIDDPGLDLEAKRKSRSREAPIREHGARELRLFGEAAREQ